MSRYKRTKTLYTIDEAVEMIENDDSVDVDNIVIIPPDNTGNVTDEEETEDRNIIPHDVPGTIEVDYTDISAEQDEQDIEFKENRPSHKSKSRTARPSWKKSETFRQPIPQEYPTAILDSHPTLAKKNPFELFSMFYTEEMNQLLVTESNRHANQKNFHRSSFTIDEMNRFSGIFLLSGYVTRPNQRLYWNTDEDVTTTIVRKAMPRNRFMDMKRRRRWRRRYSRME